MSNFPVLNHINDLLPFIADNKQFRVQDQDNGTTVVCYMLQDEDTFRGEHEDYYKECRGVTFCSKTGKVLSRTLHKFQNVGENDKTQADQIPWDKITRIMDKRDGSMITPVLLTHESNGATYIRCKTKKTFTSNEAIYATKFLRDFPEGNTWIRTLLEAGFTPTFEWTSPNSPIVLLYEKDELTLLQVRKNVTGRYMNAEEMDVLKELCPFPVVPNLVHNYPHPRDLLDHALTAEGIEGWIVQTDAGEMWKIKTKWYCELHHSVTFTRWRDIARTVLDDKSDDLKAAFAMTGRSIRPIVEVELKVHGHVALLAAAASEMAIAGKNAGLTAAQVAAKYAGNPLQKHIMRAFNGAPSDHATWLQYYLQKHITDWSLDVITEPNEDNDVNPTTE